VRPFHGQPLALPPKAVFRALDPDKDNRFEPTLKGNPGTTPVHRELQILEHFLGFRDVVNRLAGGDEFNRKGGDHRESVPFLCRLVDATSGFKQQQPATGGNSQCEEVKAFRLQAATAGKFRQHAAIRLKPRS
jgi:hypothetical protein